eukprot:1148350-Lingulodinium_polyedra.AAC.1
MPTAPKVPAGCARGRDCEDVKPRMPVLDARTLAPAPGAGPAYPFTAQRRLPIAPPPRPAALQGPR